MRTLTYKISLIIIYAFLYNILNCILNQKKRVCMYIYIIKKKKLCQADM